MLGGSRWRPEDFERFEFVSDEVTGLENLYLTHRTGRAADRRPPELTKASRWEGEFYPAGASFPLTALLRPVGGESTADRPAHRTSINAVLRLCDPLTSSETEMAGRYAPTGERPDHAVGLFPLAAPKMGNLDHPSACSDPDKLLRELPARPAPARSWACTWSTLQARQDSGADGSRALVEPDDLDGDVQRSAELAGHSGPLPVLVLPLSQQPAVLAQRRPIAEQPGPSPPDARPPAARSRAGSDGPDRPQHGRAGLASCKPIRAATTIWQAGQQPAAFGGFMPTPKERASCATCSFSSPARRSAGW